MALDPDRTVGSPPLPGQAGSLPGNSLGPERARPSRRARAPLDPDRGPAALCEPIPRTGKETHLCGSAARQPYVRLAAPTATVPARPASPNSACNLIAQQPGCSGPEGPARPGPVLGRRAGVIGAAPPAPRAMTTAAHLPPLPSTLVGALPADHRHPAGRREPWGRHGPRGARRDSCGARHPGTGSARPAAAAGPRGLARGWGAGGASITHAPRARRGLGGAAGPAGLWAGVGGSPGLGGVGERLGPSGVRRTRLPLPGARTEEVPERHVDGARWESYLLRTLVTHFVLVSSLLNPQSPCTRRGTPPDQDKARPLKEPPNLPLEFPSRVKTAPRPGARAQAPLLGSHSSSVPRKTRSFPQKRPRPGSPGMADRRLGAGGVHHTGRPGAPSQRPSWSLFQEEEVSLKAAPGSFRKQSGGTGRTCLGPRCQRSTRAGPRQPSRSRHLAETRDP